MGTERPPDRPCDLLGRQQLTGPADCSGANRVPRVCAVGVWPGGREWSSSYRHSATLPSRPTSTPRSAEQQSAQPARPQRWFSPQDMGHGQLAATQPSPTRSAHRGAGPPRSPWPGNFCRAHQAWYTANHRRRSSGAAAALPQPPGTRPTEPIAADGSQKLPVRIALLCLRNGRGAHAGRRRHRHRGLDLAPARPRCPSQRSRRDRARSAASATDEPTAVSGVLETLYSGLGDDSALVRVIIEQMEALLKRR